MKPKSGETQAAESAPALASTVAVAGASAVSWPESVRQEAVPTIPGYVLVSELGRGGMGIVYKARQVSVDRYIALKMLLGAGQAPADFLARFRTEAAAAARLQHPNIVQLFDYGDANGQPFFTLEFVPGGNLSDHWQGKPQPVDAAARLIATLADAMQYAHSQGVVHRDLKPGNVLMKVADSQAESAIPKIADFGLAKLMDSGSTQTTTGAILGTPSYMSPEQATGNTHGIGPATDIYALGAMLYEGLVGRPPFLGATGYETILQVADDDPVAPRQLRPEIPSDLETICLKCLAKSPEKRYATAQGLGDDLRRFVAHEPIAARPASILERAQLWARRHPARAILFAGLCAAAIGLALIGMRHNAELKAEHRNTRAQLIRLTVANGTKLADDGDILWSLPWFAEALRLEDDPNRATVHRIRMAALLRLSPQLKHVWADDAPPIDAKVRPDGNAVAIARDDGSVQLASLTDLRTPPRVFRPAQAGERGRGIRNSGRLLEFDPTGRWLIAQLADGVWLIDSTERASAARRLGDAKARVFWLPASRVLVCEPNRLTIHAADDTRPVSEVESPGSPIICAAADASGKWIATGHENGEVRLRQREDPEALGKVFALPGPIARLQFRPEGQRLLAAGGNLAEVWDIEAKNLAFPALHHAQTITDAAFSPDGKTIATSSQDDTSRLWNAENGLPICDPLKHISDVNRVAFSRDSKLLATCGDDNLARVWNVTTGLPHTPPLPHGGTGIAVDFGADGRSLVTASEDGTVKLWSFGPPTDRQPGTEPPLPRTPLVDGLPLGIAHQHIGRVLNAVVSPSGRLVATASEDNSARVWDAATGEPRTPPLWHNGSVRQVRFSPDERFVLTAGKGDRAYIWDIASGEEVAPVPKSEPWVGRVLANANSSEPWDLPADDRPIAELVRLAEWLSGHRVDANGALTPLLARDFERRAGQLGR